MWVLQYPVFCKPWSRFWKAKKKEKKKLKPKTLWLNNKAKWLLEVWNYHAKSSSHAQTSSEPPPLAHSTQKHGKNSQKYLGNNLLKGIRTNSKSFLNSQKQKVSSSHRVNRRSKLSSNNTQPLKESYRNLELVLGTCVVTSSPSLPFFFFF